MYNVFIIHYCEPFRLGMTTKKAIIPKKVKKEPLSEKLSVNVRLIFLLNKYKYAKQRQGRTMFDPDVVI